MFGLFAPCACVTATVIAPRELTVLDQVWRYELPAPFRGTVGPVICLVLNSSLYIFPHDGKAKNTGEQCITLGFKDAVTAARNAH